MCTRFVFSSKIRAYDHRSRAKTESYTYSVYNTLPFLNLRPLQPKKMKTIAFENPISSLRTGTQRTVHCFCLAKRFSHNAHRLRIITRWTHFSQLHTQSDGFCDNFLSQIVMQTIWIHKVSDNLILCRRIWLYFLFFRGTQWAVGRDRTID